MIIDANPKRIKTTIVNVDMRVKKWFRGSGLRVQGSGFRAQGFRTLLFLIGALGG
jgi:hypothetical protein